MGKRKAQQQEVQQEQKKEEASNQYASESDEEQIDITEQVDIALDSEAEKRIKQKIKLSKVCEHVAMFG